jgi:hypothetical protein
MEIMIELLFDAVTESACFRRVCSAIIDIKSSSTLVIEDDERRDSKLVFLLNLHMV